MKNLKIKNANFSPYKWLHLKNKILSIKLFKYYEYTVVFLQPQEYNSFLIYFYGSAHTP